MCITQNTLFKKQNHLMLHNSPGFRPANMQTFYDSGYSSLSENVSYYDSMGEYNEGTASEQQNYSHSGDVETDSDANSTFVADVETDGDANASDADLDTSISVDSSGSDHSSRSEIESEVPRHLNKRKRQGRCAPMTNLNAKQSKAKTLKGQYRAIVGGYRLSSKTRCTNLTALGIVQNKKGSYVSLKRQLSGKKSSRDKTSFIYAKNAAYAKGRNMFVWTNKRGVTSTYQSVGRYANGTLIPIYKKKETEKKN